MTSTASELSASDTIPRHRDLRTLWRLLIAIMLPIGPLTVTIARLLLPYSIADDPHIVVADIVANQDTQNLIVWLGLIATVTLLAGVLALGHLARRGAPVLATVGATLSFVAYANWGLEGNPDLLMLTATQAGIDPDTIVNVMNASASHPVAMISGISWVIGHILGTVLLAVALWRARIIPGWAGLALAISQPMHLIAAVIVPSRALDVLAGWGLTTLGFLVAAIAIARTPNEHWDLPPAART